MVSDIGSLSRSGPPAAGMPLPPTQLRHVEDTVGGTAPEAVEGLERDEATQNDPMRPRTHDAHASRDTERTGRAGQTSQTERGRNDPNQNPLDPNDPRVREKLEQAVEKINKLMGERSSLSFQIDEEYEKMVIRVVDTETDEVIRQIPSKETLKFAEYVEGLTGLIFSDKA